MNSLTSLFQPSPTVQTRTVHSVPRKHVDISHDIKATFTAASVLTDAYVSQAKKELQADATAVQVLAESHLKQARQQLGLAPPPQRHDVAYQAQSAYTAANVLGGAYAKQLKHEVRADATAANVLGGAYTNHLKHEVRADATAANVLAGAYAHAAKKEVRADTTAAQVLAHSHLQQARTQMGLAPPPPQQHDLAHQARAACTAASVLGGAYTSQAVREVRADTTALQVLFDSQARQASAQLGLTQHHAPQPSLAAHVLSSVGLVADPDTQQATEYANLEIEMNRVLQGWKTGEIYAPDAKERCLQLSTKMRSLGFITRPDVMDEHLRKGGVSEQRHTDMQREYLALTTQSAEPTLTEKVWHHMPSLFSA